jgi:hypothetical protein
VAAMKKHGLPVSYALFPDEGHGFARPENTIARAEIDSSTMQLKEGKRGIPGLD